MLMLTEGLLCFEMFNVFPVSICRGPEELSQANCHVDLANGDLLAALLDFLTICHVALARNMTWIICYRCDYLNILNV